MFDEKFMMRFQVNSTMLPANNWTLISFEKAEINICYGNCFAFQNVSSELERLLSENEMAKMNRLSLQEDKMSSIVVHAMLKKNLSEVLEKDGKDIEIIYANDDKPFIIESDLDFNLSHSGHLFSFIVADSAKLKVGVDIERIRVIDDIKTVAVRFFSQDECAYIFNSENDAPEQSYRFYEIWTCKEAFLKMIGIGLQADLREISVAPGMNILNFNLSDNFQIENYQTFIYSKRCDDFVVSVSLSEDRNPNFQEIS